ncbi:uncharacterized protein N7487_000979 [Penicillium crustosum]|uniref:uncharacterized protein n=1 Tax=Penicillium crustosum TaxID=36656 RepID=UPI002385070C|nr:uncharacterized protein N7487_000979 [Penicillium crustosum]KAJ5417429.1 hypothetical protein N7487_000979 [Penicillium crustosum]
MNTPSGAASRDSAANAFNLIEKLLHQDQASRHYQGRLESRIDSDAAAYQTLNTHCIEVERKASALEYTRSQYESSLRVAAETCQTISRDLYLERTKLLQLESRVTELYPSIDAMLHSLAPNHEDLPTGTSIQQLQQLQRDNEVQREVIACLQSTLRAREKALENLRAAMPEALDFPDNGDSTTNGDGQSSDVTDDESSIDIITESSQ